MKIGVSIPILALSNKYLKALRYVLFWLKEMRGMNVNPGKSVLQLIHQELYERLREEFKLPSKIAEDYYRMHVRFTRLGITLRKVDFQECTNPQCGTPRLSSSIDFEKMTVKIALVYSKF